METKTVAVIGAGPAGITAAYQLAKTGIRVEVFEKDAQPGGMARTISLWNQKVDIGPHRFYSKDRRVNELWLEVVGRDYGIVNRLTRIFYKGQFYFYPLQPFNALSKIGFLQSFACGFSFIQEKIFPTRLDGSFENWVISRFGRRLYEIFFKPYSEKLWGISCRELDSDFAAQRIKKLSLFEAVKNAFLKDRSQKHKTLVEHFAYPHGGTGIVYERMAEAVQKWGGTIHLKTGVRRVLVKDGRACGIELESGEVKSFDRIVSTMPLTLLVSRLDNAPPEILAASKELTFRNTIIVYLRAEPGALFPDQWIYIQSPELQTGRITNFHNWVPHLYGKEKTAVLAMEYWCYENDPIWKASDESLIALAEKELRQIAPQIKIVAPNPGVKGNESSGFVFRIPRCYPVYKCGYKEKLKQVEDYLDTVEGLLPIGRYGAFKYNNQDHSILMGILAAEKITRQTPHRLWAINTDYEDYQEATAITETGLVRSPS